MLPPFAVVDVRRLTLDAARGALPGDPIDRGPTAAPPAVPRRGLSPIWRRLADHLEPATDPAAGDR